MFTQLSVIFSLKAANLLTLKLLFQSSQREVIFSKAETHLTRYNFMHQSKSSQAELQK